MPSFERFTLHRSLNAGQLSTMSMKYERYTWSPPLYMRLFLTSFQGECQRRFPCETQGDWFSSSSSWHYHWKGTHTIVRPGLEDGKTRTTESSMETPPQLVFCSSHAGPVKTYPYVRSDPCSTVSCAQYRYITRIQYSPQELSFGVMKSSSIFASVPKYVMETWKGYQRWRERYSCCRTTWQKTTSLCCVGLLCFDIVLDVIEHIDYCCV